MINQLGKILIVLYFIISGSGKVFNFNSCIEIFKENQFTNPSLLVTMIILFELGGSLLVLFSNPDKKIIENNSTIDKNGDIISPYTKEITTDNNSDKLFFVKRKYGKFGVLLLIVYFIGYSYLFDYNNTKKLVQNIGIIGGLVLLLSIYNK